MKLLPILAILIVVGLVASACAVRSANPQATASAAATSAAVTTTATAATAMAQLISPADAKKRLDSEQGIVLVDVREPDEYAEGHIKGSLLLPLDSLSELARTELPDKDAVLFVYCRSGRRSAIAASMLAGMGYTQVFDLGGIIDWPYEIER